MEFIKNKGRQAGILYLLIAILGALTIMYVPSQLFVEGDGGVTINNIVEHETMFRLSIVGEMLVLIMEVALISTLYTMFKKVDSRITVLAILARFAMVVVMGVNVLFLGVILQLVGGAGYLGAFSSTQIQSFVLLTVDVHQFVVYIWQIFCALHLIMLGYLMYKSTFVPKWIAYVVLVGSFGYFTDSLRVFMHIQNGVAVGLFNILLAVSIVGELGFTFWLLLNKKDPKVFE